MVLLLEIWRRQILFFIIIILLLCLRGVGVKKLGYLITKYVYNVNINHTYVLLVAALLSPSTLPGETDALHLLTRVALPQIRVETLTGSQVNYEIKIKIMIYFYKIMISYEKYSTLNIY